MRRRSAILCLLLLLVAAGDVARACSCRNPALDDAAVRAAGQVFVFRLLSAAVAAQQGDEIVIESVAGSIQIVDRLRGDTRVRALSYWTSPCCGIRLDVGHYYAAFISDAGDTLQADAGNLLALGASYGEGSDRARLNDLLSGREPLDQLFPPAGRDRLLQIPPPPPPPCKPAAGGA